MNLQFIGTASAIAESGRFHSSFILNENGKIALFDCGDGISSALAKFKVSALNINSIIISHFHADHIAGLPLLITQMKILERKDKLKIFVHSSQVETLKVMLEIFYHFTDKLKFQLNIIPYYFDEEFSPFGEIKILPRQNKHVSGKYAHGNNGIISFVSASFLISDKRTSIYFTADISEPDELNIFEDKAPSILITEASHISIEQICRDNYYEMYNQVFITHYSSGLKEAIINKIKKAQVGNKIILAVDGMEVTV